MTDRYNIIPGPQLTKRQARDQTLDRWSKEWKSGKPSYKDIVNIQPGKSDDAIDVTIQTEGRYEKGDVERKGRIVSQFYFVYDQYDPDVHYLSDLGSLYTARAFQKAQSSDISVFTRSSSTSNESVLIYD